MSVEGAVPADPDSVFSVQPCDDRFLTLDPELQLKDPVLIAAFEGWNDAGDAASQTIHHLTQRWNATRVGSVDGEEFFDFSTIRPRARINTEGAREIDWPANEIFHARVDGRDVLLLSGTEPTYRWRTFCDQILALSTRCNVQMVLTLGALLAEVPHSRPVMVYGSSEDPSLGRELDLEPSSYEGPTGIVGVLHDRLKSCGFRAASLWAGVPNYVPGAPSPKAALALVGRVGTLLDLEVATMDLEIATATYEQQVAELVAEDDDTVAYVTELERRYDEADEGDGLVDEIERFLREVGD